MKKNKILKKGNKKEYVIKHKTTGDYMRFARKIEKHTKTGKNVPMWMLAVTHLMGAIDRNWDMLQAEGRRYTDIQKFVYRYPHLWEKLSKYKSELKKKRKPLTSVGFRFGKEKQKYLKKQK